RIVSIQLQDLTSHFQHFVCIIQALVGMHGVTIQQYLQFAVGELGGKVIGGCFGGNRIIRLRVSSVVGFVLRLRLGLQWTPSRWCRWLGWLRGTRLWGWLILRWLALRRRSLSLRQSDGSQPNEQNCYVLHSCSSLRIWN